VSRDRRARRRELVKAGCGARASHKNAAACLAVCAASKGPAGMSTASTGKPRYSATNVQPGAQASVPAAPKRTRPSTTNRTTIWTTSDRRRAALMALHYGPLGATRLFTRRLHLPAGFLLVKIPELKLAGLPLARVTSEREWRPSHQGLPLGAPWLSVAILSAVLGPAHVTDRRPERRAANGVGPLRTAPARSARGKQLDQPVCRSSLRSASSVPRPW